MTRKKRPLKAVVEIKPRTKGRPRLGRRRKAYTPKETLEFEAAFREAFQNQNKRRKPLQGPCTMEVSIGSRHIEVLIYELDESIRPKGVTGDIDNYQKAIQDSLNGVAYEDDKQVQHINLTFTREEP